jgi:DNA-binding FadR family transcriptional regulator
MVSKLSDTDERLRVLLLEGDFGSSGRLPSEREMAEQLRISRPALREALRRLSELGVVEVRPGAGAFMRTVDLHELAAVRLGLEPMAAELAAVHRTDAQLDEMRGAVARLAQTIDDAVTFAATDAHLHRLLATAAGNRVLSRTLATLDELAAYSRATTASDRGFRRRALTDLESVIGHVAARRPDEAAESMRRHLGRVAERLGAAHEAAGRRP